MGIAFMLNKQVLGIMITEEWMDSFFVLAIVACLLVKNLRKDIAVLAEVLECCRDFFMRLFFNIWVGAL